MAIIQISKMQVRRGQTALTGFPQLSSGELGWSIDTQQLYIGNGSVAEGAPAVGNTQIITENNVTNFFKFAKTSYTYGAAQDPNTGEEQYLVANTVFRTLQNKLDDFVNLADFGDLTSATDYTAIFQNAVNYTSKIASGKPLIVPEGTYLVTGTVYIPPLTEIRGAGAGKTVIYNSGLGATFQTIAKDGTTFDQDGGQSLSSAVRRPKNIRVNGLTLINTNTSATSIINWDCTSDSKIEDCELLGMDTSNVSTSSSLMVAGITLRDGPSYPSNTIDNLTIRNNKFYGLSNAVQSNYDVANVNITQNKFINLDKGIVFSNSLGSYGAQHVQISNNTFETINKQAIVSVATSTSFTNDINSTNNWFYDVGNNSMGDGTGTHVTEVILFGGFGNYSNGDTFDRLTKLNQTTIYATGPSNVKPIVKGPVTLRTKSPQQNVLSGQGSNNVWFSWPRSTVQYLDNEYNQLITVDYTINCLYLSLVKRGTLEVTVTGTTAFVRDTYTSNNDTEGDKIAFSAKVDVNKNLVTLYYYNGTNTPVGQKPNVIYTYTIRQ